MISDDVQHRILWIYQVDALQKISADNSKQVFRGAAFEQTAFQRPVLVNCANVVFGIKKKTAPGTFPPCKFDEFMGRRFYAVPDWRVDRFPLADGYQFLMPDIALSQQGQVFLVKGSTSLAAASTAAEAFFVDRIHCAFGIMVILDQDVLPTETRQTDKRLKSTDNCVSVSEINFYALGKLCHGLLFMGEIILIMHRTPKLNDDII